jgi:hypothetical protein
MAAGKIKDFSILPLWHISERYYSRLDDWGSIPGKGLL